MPRCARLDLIGARHLVVQRSAPPLLALAGDDSCAGFVDLLSGLPRRCGVEVQAYALLPDRYLLLLRSLCGRLGDALRWLDAAHARALKERAPFVGPLFRARPRSRVIDDDDTWREALGWVHLGPLRAHLVRQVGRARWTSHAFYAGTRAPPAWLSCHELVALCGGRGGYRRQVRAMQQQRPLQPDALEARLWTLPQPDPAAHAGVPIPVDLTPRLEQVMAVTGARPDELRTPRRGRRGNRVRLIAAWWLFSEGQVRQAEVGRALGMRAGAVAKAIHDVNRRRAQDAELAEWASNLVALRELRVGLQS